MCLHHSGAQTLKFRNWDWVQQDRAESALQQEEAVGDTEQLAGAALDEGKKGTTSSVPGMNEEKN